MTSKRTAPSGGFVPTSSRARAAGTSSAAPSTSRTSSLSRPPSAAAGISRPGSSLGTRIVAGLGPRTRSVGATAAGASGAASGRVGGVGGTVAATTTANGLKRKARTASGGVENGNGTSEEITAKRPTLSSHTSAFTAHVSQTSLNRQLLATQAKVTELENALLEKQGKLDRVEADLARLVDSEENERKGRLKAEEELSELTSKHQSVTSSLKGKLVQLEAEHEEVSDAYSLLSHQARSQKMEMATLDAELVSRDKEIALLESERDEIEEKNAELEERVAALEEMLERALAETVDSDEEGGGEIAEADEEHDRIAESAAIATEHTLDDGMQGVVEEMDELDTESASGSHQLSAGVDIAMESREGTIDPALERLQGVAEEFASTTYGSERGMPDEGEEDEDVDADGSIIDPEEDMFMSAHLKFESGTTHKPINLSVENPDDDNDAISSIASTPRIALRNEIQADKLLIEGEVEIFHDPGAPPPYSVDSPSPSLVSEASSVVGIIPHAPSVQSRSRSQSVASLSSCPAPAEARGHAPRVAPIVHDYNRDVDSDSDAVSESNYAPSSASRSRSATPAQSRSASVVSMSASDAGRSLKTPLRATRSHDKKKPERSSVIHPSLSANLSTGSPLDPLSHVRRRLSSATPTKSPKSRRQSRSSLLSQSQSLGLISALSPSVSSASLRSRENDSEIIRKELAKQTAHLKDLEATNASLSSELTRLKARITSTEVLREEKRELERRVEGVEELRRRVAELEAAQVESVTQRSLWEREKRERVDSGGGSSQGAPVSVAHQLTNLRNTHAALLDEHGALKASSRVQEVELSSTREEAEHLQHELEALRSRFDKTAEEAARKVREKELLQKEVHFLKSLVSSYKDESLADISMSESEPSSVPPSSSLASVQAVERHTEDLERLLEEYKGTIRSLEAELERLHKASTSSANKSQAEWEQIVQRTSALEKVLQEARSIIEERETQVDKLEQQLFELGAEIGCGRHVPPNTRVLSLRQNPAQEWADTRTEVLDRLKKENEVLLGRVSDLESHVSKSSGEAQPTSQGENEQLVPRVSYDILKEEVSSLQEALSAKEKRLLRLTQVFTAKSAEFREAIASILGLKLAFYPNGQVRVTSIYDLSASFVFQPDTKPRSIMRRLGEDEEAGEGEMKMQLIAAGEGGPVELEGLMNTWIRDEMCIPCFMASVTLECFDKSKMDQRQA